jgi:hypothetical protein
MSIRTLFVLWAICLFLLMTVLVAFSLQAHAHSWYEHSCCSNDDCSPTPAENVTIGPGGYLWRGTPVPNDKIRKSLDGDYHICIRKSDKAILCLYVPPGAS